MTQRDYRTNESREKHIHEFEMNFLSRQSSRKHVQIQQGLLEETIRKQSSKLIGKNNSNSKSKLKSKSKSKTKFMGNADAVDGGHSSVKPFKIMAEGRDSQDQSQDVSYAKFQLNFLSYVGEVALAYGFLIGICYLIKAANFPYFQILLTLGLLNSISPWSFSNLIMILASIIVICNHFLNITIMTYPAILICYLAVMLFNELNKVKLMFVLVLILEMTWGFALYPGLYSALDQNSKQVFYYLFPIFMLLVRVFLYIFFQMMKYSELIFLQLPFFLTGLEYGVILTLKTSSIEYWYLMVFFTLQIINDRTQFLSRILVSLLYSCRDSVANRQNEGKEDHDEKQGGSLGEKRDISVLAAHASGYSCLHSFHIVCLIYVFTELPIYSSPYTDGTVLLAYTEEQWYIPLTTWALATVYEIMCLIHERKHKDRLLMGHTKNTIPYTILRALMLTLGFWVFYLGLGMGNYLVYPQNTRFPTTA